MYNDGRSAAEAQEVQEAGEALARKLGYRFSSSFALPKLLWLRRNDGRRLTDARYFTSPTDFIIGKLTGRFDKTDYSNALKTGYDLIDHCWPSFIESALRLSADKLPQVVAPGTVIGKIQKKTAEETGLTPGTPVVAGMTDGCASQVSTGAVAPGQWNSTLGTTLVIKGVTRELIRDPDGRVYCHRHPDGFWLPGGASNTGGECISTRFKASELGALDAKALAAAPTGIIAYPLMKKGERFPFVNAEAEGFLLGGSPDGAGVYTAYLEGVGYIERLGYGVLERLGAETGDEVFAAGGAVKAEAWLQLRADILQKALLVPAESGGAMGAAIVAAGGTAFKGVVPAAESMVRIAKRVEPRPELKDAYDEGYDRFCTELKNRGYI
jgi:xylulokinase